MSKAAILTCRWLGLRPTHPSQRYGLCLLRFFHGEPATRAGNQGIARGSKPVAEVYTAARVGEWLIR